MRQELFSAFSNTTSGDHDLMSFSRLESSVKLISDFLRKYKRVLFFIAVLAIVLPEVSVYFHRPGRGADIHGYLLAGNDVLENQPLYRNSAPGKNNTWPPFFSIFITPLAISQKFLGLPVTKEIWYFFNFAALVFAIEIISYLICKKRPLFFKKKDFDFTSDLVYVPILLLLPALVSNFFMLQINALILFLVCFGLLMHLKKKPLLAGMFFGLAGAIKAYPGLFAIYFLFRKQWKTSFSIIMFGILFTISPIILYGFSGYINLMKEWLTISFSEPLVVGYTTFNNHSLYAFWERLLSHQLHLTLPASRMIRLFNLSSIFIILAVSFSIILRYPYQNNHLTNIIEFSIFSILMILFPPIAWGHYWLLLLPAFASIYYCIRKLPAIRSNLTTTLFSISILLIQIPYIFSSTAVQKFFKSHSSYTFSALIILAVLLILYVKINKENQKRRVLPASELHSQQITPDFSFREEDRCNTL